MGEIIQAGGAIAFPGEKFQNRPVTQVFWTIKVQVQPHLQRSMNTRSPKRASLKGQQLVFDVGLNFSTTGEFYNKKENPFE